MGDKFQGLLTRRFVVLTSFHIIHILNSLCILSSEMIEDPRASSLVAYFLCLIFCILTNQLYELISHIKLIFSLAVVV